MTTRKVQENWYFWNYLKEIFKYLKEILLGNF